MTTTTNPTNITGRPPDRAYRQPTSKGQRARFAALTPAAKAVVRERVRQIIDEEGGFVANAWATALEATDPANASVAGFKLGQDVEVYAFGHWYAGKVTKLNKARVVVTYTAGSGVTRDKAVNPTKKLQFHDEHGGMAVGIRLPQAQAEQVVKDAEIKATPDIDTRAKASAAKIKSNLANMAAAKNGRGELYQRALANKAEAGAKRTEKPKPLPQDDLVKHVAKLRKAHPDAKRAPEMMIARWVDGLVFSDPRWNAAWEAAS